MTAFYNAPDNDADLVASFHTAAEAQAYADEYGDGEVVASGVVFTVRNADHARARDDAAALAREEARKAIAQGAGIDTPTRTDADFDRAVEAAVQRRAGLARAGTTTPDAVDAFNASHDSPARDAAFGSHVAGHPSAFPSTTPADALPSDITSRPAENPLDPASPTPPPIDTTSVNENDQAGDGR